MFHHQGEHIVTLPFSLTKTIHSARAGQQENYTQNPSIFFQLKVKQTITTGQITKVCVTDVSSNHIIFSFFQWLFMPRRSFEHFVSLLQYCPRFLVVSFRLIGILFFCFPHLRSTRRYVDSVLFMSRLDAREAYLA